MKCYFIIGSGSRKCLVNEEDNTEIQGITFRPTGDLVEITNEKHYYIGRKNDIVKRYGHRINLNQISDSINKKTSIQNVCVWQELESKLLLFLLIKDYDNILKEKMIDKIRVKLFHELPKEHFPDFVGALSTFPLTNHGKIDKATLIEVYRSTNSIEQQRSSSKNAANVFNNLIAKYFGLSRKQLQIYKNCSFFDIGGNSILIMQFLEEFKKILSRELPSELVTVLFEKNLDYCRRYIEQQDLKRTIDMVPDVSPIKLKNKSIKIDHSENANYDFDMRILWKYDLKACVDCSPAIIRNRYVKL